MANKVRITAGSAYEVGWYAGWLHVPGIHETPKPPPRSGTRARERWLAGFQAGTESRLTRAEIDRQKALREWSPTRRLVHEFVMRWCS